MSQTKERFIAALQERVANPQVDLEKIKLILSSHLREETGFEVEIVVCGSLDMARRLITDDVTIIPPWRLQFGVVGGRGLYPRWGLGTIPGANILEGLLGGNDDVSLRENTMQCAALAVHSSIFDDGTTRPDRDRMFNRHGEEIVVPERVKRIERAFDMMLELYMLGLAFMWVYVPKVFIVPKPKLVTEPWDGRTRGGARLHCDTGPAVIWHDGTEQYFIHGVEVRKELVLEKETITAEQISKEENAEQRRIMINIFGAARYIREIGAKMVQRDECGELYMVQYKDDESLVMVKVLNATPEPDGTRKEYFLRVPPTIRTARAAVAWTFDIRPDLYQPSFES